MAISFPNGFRITSTEAVDTRLVLTKAEMQSMKKAQMPLVYFCMCKDDGKLYLYNDNNPLDPIIGRFRVFEAESSGSGSTDIDWGILGR